MAEVTAFHNASPGNGAPGSLSHFTDTIVLSLEDLPQGLYVVHARLSVANRDGDDQNTSCGLRIRSSLDFIDRIDQRLTAWAEPYFPLQGVLRLEERDTIDLVAGTYNGYAGSPSIIAVTVDNLNPAI